MAAPMRPAAWSGSIPWSHLAAAAPAAAALALAELVAASAARAGWVAGSSMLPGVALVAVATGCLLGAGRIGAAAGLGLGALAGVAAAAAAAAGGVPPHEWLGLARSWPGELASGRTDGDPVLLRFLLALLVWLVAVWLAWAVLRVRAVIWAVAPAGAVLAVDVLNFPEGQDPYVFWFLLVVLTFLLWSTYRDSVASAVRQRLELPAGARWDFWERGAVAAAALIAAGVLLPPLSGVDQTGDVQNGFVAAWGRVTHAAGGEATSSGFSDQASLSGPLRPSSLVVFTYSVSGDAPGPSYFHGLDLVPLRGEWAFQSGQVSSQHLAAGDEIAYEERYRETRSVTYAIDMVRPPSVAPDLVFYPGQLAAADRALRVAQALPYGVFGASVLETVDRVTGPEARGSYHVVVDESTASEAELRAAGTDYPSWIAPYRELPGFYRPARTLSAIRSLAERVTAGVADPYDQASAIEAYLRAGFTYTLSPPPVPAGTDPEEYFLLASRAGYCQYFATAMADMLRSLGIPVRLVNGYGPGTYDPGGRRFVVRESDAHTWPEAYFPSYGWIAFEPTPDGVYFPVQRGAGTGAPCTGDACSAAPAAGALSSPAAGPASPRPERTPAGGAAGRLPALAWPTRWPAAAAILLLLCVLAAVLVSRYLRPRTPADVWRRTTLLVRLAGVPPRPGETPIEFGDRVAGRFPEAAPHIRRLAGDFAAAAYGPPGLAEQRTPALLDGWTALRPFLLRRVVSRRPPRREAGLGSAEPA